MTTECKDFLSNWIITFLSTPQEILSGYPPCPYARKALVENKINFVSSTNYSDVILEEVTNWNNLFDVLLVECGNVDKDQFVNDVANINNKLLVKGFVALEDHVEIEEPLQHLDFRNGKYNIILVQRLDKINQAGASLKKLGYYNNWSDDMIDSVVTWRLNVAQESQTL
jgi:hypothetical protein